MKKYLDYFNSLNEFKYKKEIINDIYNLFNHELNNKEQNKLIKQLISNSIVLKSAPKGRCAYISKQFLDKNNLNVISYFNEIKLKSNKEIPINNNNVKIDNINNLNDAIIIVDVEDLFNEL